MSKSWSWQRLWFHLIGLIKQASFEMGCKCFGKKRNNNRLRTEWIIGCSEVNRWLVMGACTSKWNDLMHTLIILLNACVSNILFLWRKCCLCFDQNTCQQINLGHYSNVTRKSIEPMPQNLSIGFGIYDKCDKRTIMNMVRNVEIKIKSLYIIISFSVNVYTMTKEDT